MYSWLYGLDLLEEAARSMFLPHRMDALFALVALGAAAYFHWGDWFGVAFSAILAYGAGALLYSVGMQIRADILTSLACGEQEGESAEAVG